MELIIEQLITLKGKLKTGDYFTARRSYNNVDFLPKVGDIIEESVYHRNDPEFKVYKTSFNYDEGYYIAYLEPYTIDSEDRNYIEKMKTTFKEHDWQVLNT
ncbi:hypothetical protein BK129_18855 [Paenibacillus amylolyticus]|uniref:hypothetical protein n=1 Tax=Paenibacillus amylolyticus TaxID=1451 RepID=UPI00096F1A1C|nr:hypothetical protein [Paenibacillus amylolyticus]OMF04020.1 hypothetical protein BK129_18855 [Paenibacillus amylolyticus]